MKFLENFDKFLESDTSATGGPAIGGGMGAVVSAQPSALAGTTVGPSWSDNGGTTGSGDVSVPYNVGGALGSQKIPIMGKNHGPRTGKKSREKRLDLKAIRNSLKGRKDISKTGEKKVMSFDDFAKADVNKVTKVKE